MCHPGLDRGDVRGHDRSAASPSPLTIITDEAVMPAIDHVVLGPTRRSDLFHRPRSTWRPDPVRVAASSGFRGSRCRWWCHSRAPWRAWSVRRSGPARGSRSRPGRASGVTRRRTGPRRHDLEDRHLIEEGHGPTTRKVDDVRCFSVSRTSRPPSSSTSSAGWRWGRASAASTSSSTSRARSSWRSTDAGPWPRTRAPRGGHRVAPDRRRRGHGVVHRPGRVHLETTCSVAATSSTDGER